MPHHERPREKMLHQGKELMSNVELVAIILRTGHQHKNVLELAKAIVYQKDSLQAVANMTVEELCNIKGIGTSKAIQLKAAFELGRRTAQEQSKQKLILSSPESIFSYIKHDVKSNTRTFYRSIFYNKRRIDQT